ncbi:AraC family transcriptional regulator [Paenibacillus woosongensis]|uniref:Helix-turn-helix domain-containing protein n=1 Tax=Paenibacillus woosongensis TaxID=307580 RepID=A0A7X2Z671_9BACL|nr:AraC family transcriptional regulator [Paenibacillus woosongensis]MUG47723.1 helix-turn-helix domain-containing protein [Paenibacillus woosongensis]
MDWLSRMNSAMEYVETHLSEEIEYEQVARIACCSTYHFQRMFSFITGLPLSEYIRRRRLTLAAFELQQSNAKVIDIALKYGYESPEAFSRAFKKLHGVMPSSARDKGIELKAYPRLSFHISIRGDVEMNYKIEDKQAFDMFGISTVINANKDFLEQPFSEIPKFWTKCVSDGTIDRIRAAAGLGECQLHGVLYNSQGEKFSYMIGYFLPQSGLPEGFEQLQIPLQTYAIFSTGLYPDGQSGIHDLWRRIWGEWFPSSNYEFANGHEFEMTYDRGNNMYEMEIWIPVVKKLNA